MAFFSEYFSEEAIIEALCRARVKLAEQRHDAAFQHNIARTARAPDTITPTDWGPIPLDIFPSRRLWHRFRPRRRGNRGAAEVNQRALLAAVMKLREQKPTATWAVGLANVVARIRSRVLSKRAFRFKPPTIIPLAKEPGGHIYRPLAVYTLEDRIIEGITARYLRTTLDKALLRSCMAFRCRTKNRPAPTTHDALKRILRMRARYPGQVLTVAECDIKGFYDCVGHRIAREALDDLIADAIKRDPAISIDEGGVPRLVEGSLLSKTAGWTLK